jgi:ELWxxDGT repeat protein
MKRRNAMIERLEVRRMLSAAMVKDLNTTPSPISGLSNWVGAGNTVFLTQDDGVAGAELYKTDGTTNGTVLVKDIRPGRDNSRPGWLTHRGDGTIFFTADDGANGLELWKSDGTTAGTVMVKDINPGGASSGAGGLVNVNGTIFFSANDGTNGVELWKSDGTEAGTVMVKNIATAAGVGSGVGHLINNNGVLFFRASNGTSGFELWKSDGTELGTVQVAELYNNNNDGMANTPMTVMNGFVYFAGRSAIGATDVWRSDGSGPGTTLVKDLSSSQSSPANLRTSGSRVYFTVSNAADVGLWSTDGTTTTNVLAASTMGWADVSGTLFFGSGTTLYSTTGGAPATVKTGLTLNSILAQGWTGHNGTLYFGVNGGDGAGEELWKSNGTTPGTELVKDIEPGPLPSNPLALVPYGPGGASGLIVGTFSGAGTIGAAIWKSDGTGPGTTLVKDISPATDSSGPLLMTAFKQHVYFIASEPVHSGGGLVGELYRSDGTAAGTGNFVDIVPGPGHASVSNLRAYGDYLYFAANDGLGGGKELWRTDGVSAQRVKDIFAGASSSNPSTGVGSGDYYYFLATDANGVELWRTDGSEPGTVRLTNNPTGFTVNQMTDVDGWLYFVLNNGSTFFGLSRTSGSGAQLINSSFTAVSSMINVNGTLYISATTSADGAELYKLAPGAAEPVLVKDIGGLGSSSPGNFTNVDGTLFFTAATSANGVELWKSDGTEAGTVLVKDIRSGPSNAAIQNMVTTNGVAYFRADNGVVGSEIWRSDGTEAGTYLLKDIAPPGATDGNPTRLFAANGFLYFAASNENEPTPEAWRSDGTEQGTQMLGDYFPKGNSILYPSNAAFFTALGGEVFYLFTDDTYGSELWKADQPDFATLAAGGALTLTGTATSDVIDVAVDGAGGVVVALNGMTETFAPGQVTSLNVATGIGRDTLTVSSGTIAFNSDAGAGTANLALRIAPGAAAVFNASQHLRELDVDGVATLAQGGGKVIVTRSLEVDGRLNLKDNNLVLDYDPADANPIAAIEARIASAYHDNQWDLPGIFTDMTQATDGLTTLALSDPLAMRGLGPTATMLFAGETIDGSSVVIKYSWAGDLNLDGLVDAQDYGVIDNWVQFPGTRGYANGDINFDGVIDATDYGIIDNTIQLQGPPLTTSSASAASVVDSQDVVATAPVTGKTARPKPRRGNRR